eukprot:TRINITY_DN44877_c0_g1_i2.p1 TRINITY_DN44877_c0_g1~~TRINITY_DN44877_c0_g1_i2.p1  ORF type:complete len:205 (+),score=65.24 TRINITY_DN44877_c0_g1_i2:127-741(+)
MCIRDRDKETTVLLERPSQRPEARAPAQIHGKEVYFPVLLVLGCFCAVMLLSFTFIDWTGQQQLVKEAKQREVKAGFARDRLHAEEMAFGIERQIVGAQRAEQAKTQKFFDKKQAALAAYSTALDKEATALHKEETLVGKEVTDANKLNALVRKEVEAQDRFKQALDKEGALLSTQERLLLKHKNHKLSAALPPVPPAQVTSLG